MELLVWSRYTNLRRTPEKGKVSIALQRYSYPIGPPLDDMERLDGFQAHEVTKSRYKNILNRISHRFNLETSVLVLAHIYLCKFHIVVGRVTYFDGFNISVAAMLIAIKMLYEQTGNLNAKMAVLAKRSVQQINDFELAFLQTLKFNTHITKKEYEFMKEFMKA